MERTIFNLHPFAVPKAVFAGAAAKDLKMRATDSSGLTTGLIKKGTWTITSTDVGAADSKGPFQKGVKDNKLRLSR